MTKQPSNEDELALIVSTLMLEVMRLRNTYKYNIIAPQAFNDEMDVAYHKAHSAITKLIREQRADAIKSYKKILKLEQAELQTQANKAKLKSMLGEIE